MKKLFSLCLCVVVFAYLFVGCGSGASDGTSSVQWVSSQTTDTTETWNQVCPEPVPEHKIYTIYSTPTDGIKSGVAASPNTDVNKVKNLEELYFVHLGAYHEESDSTNDNLNKTTDIEEGVENFSFKVNSVEYNATYKETVTIERSYFSGDEVLEYTEKYDNFDIEHIESERSISGEITVARSTGWIVFFNVSPSSGYFDNDKTVISETEEHEKVDEAIKFFLNGEIPEGFVPNEDTTGLMDNSFVRYYFTVGGYRTDCTLSADITDSGLLTMFIMSDGYLAYNDAFDRIEHDINKAAEVLKDSLENVKVLQEILSFDTKAELYFRVISSEHYSNGCDCVHHKQYCVKIIDNPAVHIRFEILDTKGNTVITENHIEQANVGDGTVNGQHYVHIQLDRAGTELLNYVTSQSKGQKLPFYLDGELIFEPTVVATIDSGELSILVDTKEEAEAIYEKISSAMHGEEK